MSTPKHTHTWIQAEDGNYYLCTQVGGEWTIDDKLLRKTPEQHRAVLKRQAAHRKDTIFFRILCYFFLFLTIATLFCSLTGIFNRAYQSGAKGNAEKALNSLNKTKAVVALENIMYQVESPIFDAATIQHEKGLGAKLNEFGELILDTELTLAQVGSTEQPLQNEKKFKVWKELAVVLSNLSEKARKEMSSKELQATGEFLKRYAEFEKQYNEFVAEYGKL